VGINGEAALASLDINGVSGTTPLRSFGTNGVAASFVVTNTTSIIELYRNLGGSLYGGQLSADNSGAYFNSSGAHNFRFFMNGTEAVSITDTVVDVKVPMRLPAVTADRMAIWDGSKLLTYGTVGTAFASEGDKGDITVSGGGATWTIDNSAVTLAKIQNLSVSTLLGRGDSGFGAPQEITLGAGLAMTGTTLSVSGGATGETNTASNLGAGTGVYAGKTGVDLQFNSLTGANGITVSSNANLLTISNVETNTTTIAMSDTTTSLSSGTEKQYWRAPYAFTIKAVKLTVGTVSSSGIVRVNVKEAGTTIFSTRISIDASEETSETAATAYALSDTSIASNAKLTFDIDDAGTGAKNLQITLYHTKN
jgi:hypothetical protein